MFRLPSALPEPKKNTYFRDLGLGAWDLGLAWGFFFAAFFFAIGTPSSKTEFGD
jgi:hypothetical protein